MQAHHSWLSPSNVADLGDRDKIWLNFIADLGELLKSVGKPDQSRLIKISPQKRDPEATRSQTRLLHKKIYENLRDIRSGVHEVASVVHCHRCPGRVEAKRDCDDWRAHDGRERRGEGGR
jgi:hypothetical protein